MTDMLPRAAGVHRHAAFVSGGGVARNFPSSYLLMLRSPSLAFVMALPRRVVVYGRSGAVPPPRLRYEEGVAFRFVLGRLEKAQVMRLLQKRQHVFSAHL